MESPTRVESPVELGNNPPDRVGKKPTLWTFLKDVCGLAVAVILAVIVFGGVYFAINGLSLENVSFWYSVFFYLIFFVAFVVWVKWVKHQQVRPLFLSRPRWPAKEHRWFYIAYIMVWSGIILTFVTLDAQGIVIFPRFSGMVVTLLVSCVGAPVVEEVVFRGYLYAQAEEVWGKGRFFRVWNRHIWNSRGGDTTLQRLMSFEITYPALATSIIFGIYHLNPIQSVITFIGGLLFCKFRNEWGTTLVAPMIFHASWNFLVVTLGLLPAQVYTSLLVVWGGIIILILAGVSIGRYFTAGWKEWQDQMRPR